jgi:hypothetical protein
MDNNKVPNDTTEMEMVGDTIVMHEDVTTINMQELHTDMNKEDHVAKMELLTKDSNLYDRKHVTNKVTRRERGLNDEDTKQEVLSKVGDMTLNDTITFVEARETGKLATKSLGSKMSSTVVNQVQEKADKKNCSYCGNKGHGKRANFETRKAKCPAHGQACTKCQHKDHFAAVCESAKEDLPANDKMMAKYEGKEEHDVQSSIKVTYRMDVANTYPEFDITETGTNKPPGKTTMKEEPPDNENFTISSQKGDVDEPTADLRREEAYSVREFPINIDETNQEDVANYGQIEGVANQEEPRGSP